MSDMKVRSINNFNEAVRNKKFHNIDDNLEPMPYIVVVMNELADLMIVAGKEIESMIQRLAQMARACGIHLIVATQDHP